MAFARKFFVYGYGIYLLKIICDVKQKVICSYNRNGHNIGNHIQNLELEILKT